MEASNFNTVDESANENSVGAETVDVVLEEAEIVDCDADETDDEVQYLYAVNSDNTVAYKLMQLSNSDRESKEVSLATPVNNTVQVLTTPLNGQFYVLSNSDNVVTSDSDKAVVPNVAKLQIKRPRGIVTKRNERRRAIHNEVERRRRDMISKWISELARIMGNCDLQTVNEEDEAKPVPLPNKGDILSQAYEYITESKDIPERLTQSMDENAQLIGEIKRLRQLVNQLQNENAQLRTQISKEDDISILGT